MPQILALLQNIAPLLEPVTFRQMSRIIFAMLSLSRWADKGGRYRTIQRWYLTEFSWEIIHWTLFFKSLLKLLGEYIIASTSRSQALAEDYRHGRIAEICGSGRSFWQLSECIHGQG